MEFQFFKPYAICLSLLLPFSAANAAIIDNDWYTTDTESGLDWLDVTITDGLTYEYVSTQFGSGGEYEGWRYATAEEFNTLTSHYTGVSYETLSLRNRFVRIDGDKIDGLVELLGSTLDEGSIKWTGQTWDAANGYEEGEGYDYTFGHLANPNNPNSSWFGWLVDDQLGFDSSYVWEGIHEPEDGVGSYLVRATSTAVPEPSLWVLMGIGWISLVISRKKALSVRDKVFRLGK